MKATFCEYGIVARACPAIRPVLRELTTTYEPRIGFPIKRENFKFARQANGAEMYILPRGACAALVRAGYEIAEKKTTHTHVSLIAPPPDFLFENQIPLVRRVVDTLVGTRFHCACLNLRAGYGKTFIGAGIIHMLGSPRTLYIVPTVELAKQVRKDITAAIDATVDVVVINSALNIANIAQSYDLTIFDEVHMYCSSARSEIFWRTQTRYMFGMSATTEDRRDGFDVIAIQHLAPLVRAEDVAGFAYDDPSASFTIGVDVVNYYALDPQNLVHESTGHVFAHYMYEQFARDEIRNMLILHRLRDLVARGHNVFVFAEERAHLAHLEEMTRDAFPEIRTALFWGGIGGDERIAAIEDARIIFATYSYSGTGVSIPRMTAIVFASPRYANMKQIVGRILRRTTDEELARKPREIVDIVDKGTALAHQLRFRNVAYDFYGATVARSIFRALAPPQ